LGYGRATAAPDGAGDVADSGAEPAAAEAGAEGAEEEDAEAEEAA
jgi:hypothetical protein